MVNDLKKLKRHKNQQFICLLEPASEKVLKKYTLACTLLKYDLFERYAENACFY